LFYINDLLFEFKYNDVFDTKGAKDYINNYERLLSESSLYRSVDGFSLGTYQASQLLQNVSDGNF